MWECTSSSSWIFLNDHQYVVFEIHSHFHDVFIWSWWCKIIGTCWNMLENNTIQMPSIVHRFIDPCPLFSIIIVDHPVFFYCVYPAFTTHWTSFCISQLFSWIEGLMRLASHGVWTLSQTFTPKHNKNLMWISCTQEKIITHNYSYFLLSMQKLDGSMV